MFDCHAHSYFSYDSELDGEAACEAAIKHRLDGIIFTDHLDYDFPGHSDDIIIDFKACLEYISTLADKYRSSLKVLKGIEVGIQPHVVEKSLKIAGNFDFDYILASVHVIDRIDPCEGTYYKDRTKKEAYGRYLESMLYMVRNFENFDVAGHFDYITRYANYGDRTLRYADHCDLLDSLFKELIYRGKGLEINTAAFRESQYGSRIPEFDIRILKRFKELGGEIVCLGSDSHKKEFIGYKFDYFSQVLKDAGFKYTAHFENRKPVFDLI